MPGRSTEAELRDILETTVRPPERLRLGTALAQLGRRVGLTDEDFAAVERVRDNTPAEPVRFRSEEHTSELQSLMRISYAVFCLKKKTQHKQIMRQIANITKQYTDINDTYQ